MPGDDMPRDERRRREHRDDPDAAAPHHRPPPADPKSGRGGGYRGVQGPHQAVRGRGRRVGRGDREGTPPLPAPGRRAARVRRQGRGKGRHRLHVQFLVRAEAVPRAGAVHAGPARVQRRLLEAGGHHAQAPGVSAVGEGRRTRPLRRRPRAGGKVPGLPPPHGRYAQGRLRSHGRHRVPVQGPGRHQAVDGQVRTPGHGDLGPALAGAGGAAVRHARHGPHGGPERGHHPPAADAPARPDPGPREAAVRRHHGLRAVHGLDLGASRVPRAAVHLHRLVLPDRLQGDHPRGRPGGQVLLRRLQRAPQRPGRPAAQLLRPDPRQAARDQPGGDDRGRGHGGGGAEEGGHLQTPEAVLRPPDHASDVQGRQRDDARGQAGRRRYVQARGRGEDAG